MRCREMGRVLTIQRMMVPSTDRARYVERLPARRAQYERANCRFWVFEELGLPGLFMEFTEAKDAATLTAAHREVHERPRDPARLYAEVEIA
jgi:hypothetical protein